MAQIKDYATQVSADQEISDRYRDRAAPEDFGSGAIGDIGAGVQNAGNVMADVEQRDEVSNVNVTLAQARSAWTTHLAERAAHAQAGDPAFAQKFSDDLSDYMSGLGQNIRTAAGQRAFTTGAAELQASLNAKAGQWQIQSAGVKAVQDHFTIQDNNRNTLLNDPSQFDAVMKANDAALNDPNGPYKDLPADKRVELQRQDREQLAKSAVEGIIRADPKEALKQLQDGKWGSYLNGDAMTGLMYRADMGIRAGEVEQRRQEEYAKKQLEAAQEKTRQGFVKQMVEKPGSLKATDIVNSNLTGTEQEHFLNLVDPNWQDKNPMATDVRTYGPGFLDLYRRALLPDGDPNQLTNDSQVIPHVGKDLTVAGMNQMEAVFSGKKTMDGGIENELKKGFMQTWKTQLTGTNEKLNLRDPKGDVQLQKAIAYFLPEYERQRAAGKTPVQLLNPDSPDYIGKGMDQFKRPLSEMIKDLIDANPDTYAVGGASAPDAAGVPPSIAKVPGLQYSASKKQYRDPASGKVYDKDGVEVKQ